VPAWLIALLVAFVGLLAGLLGTYVRIGFERGADLRTRMLDAADEFVTAMTKAQDAVSLASLRVIGWTHAWLSAPESDRRRTTEAEAEGAYETASTLWNAAVERVPRIRLLFGVDAPATLAAKRATDELGAGVLMLAQIRAGEGAAAMADLDEASRVSDQVDSRIDAAAQATNDFSRAARTAIAGEGPSAKIIRASQSVVGGRPVVRDSCEEEAATDDGRASATTADSAKRGGTD
jgi:hypothetical protein